MVGINHKPLGMGMPGISEKYGDTYDPGLKSDLTKSLKALQDKAPKILEQNKYIMQKTPLSELDGVSQLGTALTWPTDDVPVRNALLGLAYVLTGANINYSSPSAGAYGAFQVNAAIHGDVKLGDPVRQMNQAKLILPEMIADKIGIPYVLTPTIIARIASLWRTPSDKTYREEAKYLPKAEEFIKKYPHYANTTKPSPSQSKPVAPIDDLPRGEKIPSVTSSDNKNLMIFGLIGVALVGAYFYFK